MADRLILLIATVYLSTCLATAGSGVIVPSDTSWESLKPYLEANIRVEFSDGALTVGVSGAIYERKLFEPYDPLMGELATVLLGEVLAEKKAKKTISELADRLKDEVPDLASMDREDLSRLYWQHVETDGRLLKWAEQTFERAVAVGQLNCMICNEGFAPEHLQVL